MKIAIFGTGYVGLVTGTCFAQMGNHVVCVDINAKRVEELNQGICPIFEPGLTELLTKNIEAKRLQFTTNSKDAIDHGDIIFIAVGTPAKEDGSAKLDYVIDVAETIGKHINNYKVIVNKSTVPVGTADTVYKTIKENCNNIEFDVASNPEFLKEGDAINDCLKPDRIIIGVNSRKAEEYLHELYAPFNRNHDKLLVMDVRSAELTKYAANAMLATKISFMNEMSQIAEHLGADIEQVRRGIGSDPRIGYSFIYPGCGYGGSCFPKDVQALYHTAKQTNYDAKILETVHSVNELQKKVLGNKIKKYFNNDLSGKHFAIWGLSFKPNTDDIRDAPSCVLIDTLLGSGATISAYDPEAMQAIKERYQDKQALTLANSPENALDKADGLVVVTEWMSFRSPNFDLIKEKLNHAVIFDGRNLYDPEQLRKRGIDYLAIGRSNI